MLVAALCGLAPSPSAAAVPGPVPGADWVVDAPAAHGMDATLLDQARDYAFVPGRNTQGVVVVHRGAIVGEWYAPGTGPTSYAASWSMAKSFTSALIGIAIAEGKIPSIDVPMVTYFPDWAGSPRASITLRHVLHMESGLDWNEDYNPSGLSSSQIIQMVSLESDQLAYAAARPARVAPGTAFNYSSGDTMLLSAVIQQATGLVPEEYARQKLFGPIGIDQVEWWRDAAGHTLTYCCLDTTSRDFARFGLLYLRGGNWGGDQVVPASWVDASVADTATTYGGYGYQWWLQPEPAGVVPPYFSAQGHDGQFIYVIPSLDLVVVRNGTYVKSPCPPVADPTLLWYYPPSGLVDGQGTTPPDSWSDLEFLTPIVQSLTGGGAAAGEARPARALEPGAPDQKQTAADPAPCPIAPTPTTTPPGATPTSAAASTTGPTPTAFTATAPTALVATPRFAG